MRKKLVEAVAAALYEAAKSPLAPKWKDAGDLREGYLRDARDALKGIAKSGTHVVVPIEPTLEMVEAGNLAATSNQPLWPAMLAARPKV